MVRYAEDSLFERGVKIANMRQQIDALAEFIVAEIPGEPSQSQGAVFTAMRIMQEQAARIAELEAGIKEHADRLAVVREWCVIPDETEAGINGILDAFNGLVDKENNAS